MTTCLTEAEALACAVRLRPFLQERAAQTEEQRRLPVQTWTELQQCGLLRLLQPARVGGAELPLTALVSVTAELARGCAATAWVVANLASHHWMLGMWPRAAQDAVWGAAGEWANRRVAASLIFPAGRARPTASGYRLSGRWAYASGIDDSDWVMLGAIVCSDDDGVSAEAGYLGKTGEYRLFLLEKNQYQVRDTWRSMGLCGSGSNEIEVREADIPALLSLPLSATQGAAELFAAEALYTLPLLPAFGYVIAAVALGIAQGALDLFMGENSDRLASYSGRLMTDYPTVHLRVAEAAAHIDAARRVLLGNCTDLQHQAAVGQNWTLLEKMRLRRDAAFAARLCSNALDQLFVACGGAALYLTHPAQRALRDMRATCAHISLNWDAAATLYGRVAVGHGADLPPYER